MFILFSLIVMRMSGAVALNPILGRSNYPRTAKGALILMLSLLLYTGFGGRLAHEPSSMAEYAVMLATELLFGFVIGFSMELSFLTVRFASAIMDHSMGLTMAQVYDPEQHTQVTLTSSMFYTLLAMLFFASDGHLRLIEIFYNSARRIPFGTVSLRPELSLAMLDIFGGCIVLGLQLAFPLIAMELLAETAVGILMRMIPQINVFSVNFQVKIIVGLTMLVLMFGPMSDKLYLILDNMFQSMETLVTLI